jgi:hypothetical protein
MQGMTRPHSVGSMGSPLEMQCYRHNYGVDQPRTDALHISLDFGKSSRRSVSIPSPEAISQRISFTAEREEKLEA